MKTIICKDRVLAKSLETGRLVAINKHQAVLLISKASNGHIVRVAGMRLLVDEQGMKRLLSQ